MKKSSLILASVSFALAATPSLAQALAEEQAIVLDEITVSANRTPTEAAKTGSTVLVVTSEELEREGDTFVQDYLARLPGITVSQNGPAGTASTLRIRGLGNKYLQVRIDGINISDPTGTQVAARLTDLLTADIERIEVLKGSQSALYGGQAVGGVIDIRTKRAKAGEVNHRASVEGGSYGTFNGAYGISAGFDRGQISLNAQHLRSDGFSALDENENPGADDDGYRNTTLSGRADYDLTDALAVYSAVRYYNARNEYDGFGAPSAQNHEDSEYRAGLVGTKLSLIDDRFISDLSFQISRIDREIHSDNPGTYRGDRQAVEYLGSYELNDTVSVVFGGDWANEEVDLSSGLNEDTQIWGGFAQLNLDLFDRLALTGSVRRDDHSQFGEQWTWRSSAAFEVDAATTLRSSIGTGFRAPSNYELYHPTYGNAQLEPETSLSFDVGVDRVWFDGRLLTSATYFYIQREDLIDYSFATSGYVQVDGTSKNQGVELSAEYAVNERLALSTAYTYTDSEDPDGARLVRVPLHDLSLGLVYQPNDNWTVSMNGNYVADTIDSQWPGTTELDDYFLLNGKVSYAFDEGPELYLRAENILDQEYQTANGYGTAGFSVYAGVKAQF
ncbi:TonB-dependent receptor plug domain-containing protein [Pseudovibrio sp. SPO723]|uniref:TonB-dependent receptor plug domain-containing protein n=1 Tax=Nesiotobacter zosterae TaxID=392721 RepID=UPI0029C15EA2|nr:TonB-dependent receptor [Pseudovibrio sp. SPO723]MDX5591937.1 TonB-dependent receptor [Pseudovibrio sp. SPO723]